MVINTVGGLVVDVATTEDVAELYSLSEGFHSRLTCVAGEQNYTANKIDTLSDEIASIKEKLDRIIEMYGVVQLRCDDNMGISHVDLSDHGDLSGLFGGNI